MNSTCLNCAHFSIKKNAHWGECKNTVSERIKVLPDEPTCFFFKRGKKMSLLKYESSRLINKIRDDIAIVQDDLKHALEYLEKGNYNLAAAQLFRATQTELTHALWLTSELAGIQKAEKEK